MSTQVVLSLDSTGTSVTITASPEGLSVEHASEDSLLCATFPRCCTVEPDIHFTWWDVVWIKLKEDQLQLDAIQYKPKETSGRLRTFRGTLKVTDSKAAQVWTDNGMKYAYPSVLRILADVFISHNPLITDSTPSRRARVFVNPVGGKGNAKRCFTEIVKPILEAAHCHYDVVCEDPHNRCSLRLESNWVL